LALRPECQEKAAIMADKARAGGKMADLPRKILVCSCEDSMPLDAAGLRRGCRAADLSMAHQLCRAEIERFRSAATEGGLITVGCTQEAPLFSEIVEE